MPPLVGEFAGIAATGSAVRVPYSAFYDVDAGRITALRVDMDIAQLVAQIHTPTEPGM